MKHIGLKFLFHGNYLAVVVTEDIATEVLSRWKRWIEADIGNATISNLDVPSPVATDPWCIRIGSIDAIHTFNLDAVQQQQQATIKPWKGSGLC